ncbi:hypothetical protein DFH11DRAFT_952565 [Phellopilus nigrolimitatus]|nr:hypothetical protein DFH11DRAFT_952565 [Phellopilus nigrolimitatus]
MLRDHSTLLTSASSPQRLYTLYIMLSGITVFLSLLAATKIRPVTAQAFSLVCQGAAGYPDVCDTFTFANFCHGISNVQHYDGTNDPKKGDQRRAAVGSSGVANQCAGKGASVQCDEYPYASTYDGGLGCYPNGYHGTDHLAQAGATRCVDGTQNGRHGQAIAQFYRKALNRNNGRSL